MGFPIAYVLVAALLFDMTFASCVQLLLSPMFYLVSLVAVFSGWGLWEMHRWAWYMLSVANIAILYQTAVVMNQYSESHHRVSAFFLSVLTILLFFLRISKEVRVPYFFPKIRWWESDPRYRLAVQSEITRKVSEEKLNAEILDLSATGCFIKTRTDLKTDEPISVRFELFKLAVQCDGIVVWKSESTVTHPKGVGVKFSAPERQAKRHLRMMTKRLKAIAQLYRTSRYLMTSDEFAHKLEELESQSFHKKKKTDAAS
jgi:Tfp pilus assembly protein PilZ